MKEYCSVIKTKLGALWILMGAKMDCCDSTNEGRSFMWKRKQVVSWITTLNKDLRGKSYSSFGDDSGRLVGTKRLRTKDITHRVKMKNYWQGGVCLTIADDVLCWLYGTVKESKIFHFCIFYQGMKTTYILQFVAPFTRFKLLQAQSCPQEITDHVQQLRNTHS
ncbi:NAD-capped RNA hydrolase DXO1-like [Lactuca sativa]|uniref:Decapping nuclease n=1 Tax=Lactuca sativa TaxID=4236 RepID=A0A9R1WCK0_LACSA|nr:NAD-capped RNA hydrolase DXO1-like [Lactuca sativa]KAJ0220106.1 hypothetical protein LSAT_V11C200055010 [Lactuca sativa]